MFATIRRHQKWLWALIIAIIIPSFVIFFTPDATLPGFDRDRGDFGTIDGRPITRKQFLEAYRETELYYLLNYGAWPDRQEANRFGFDVEREARSRVLLLEKVKESKIHVSDESVAAWIRNLSAFRDRRQGVFRLDAYTQFIQQELNPKGLRESDFEHFVAHQLGIQELIKVYGLNGTFVTPQAAEMYYRREHEPFDAEAVIFSASNYLANVTISTNALQQFYTNRLSVYRIPERVQVSYVKFDLTNFVTEAQQQLAKETNLTQYLEAYYQQQGPNFFTDTNGNALPPTEAKVQIRKQMEQRGALEAARKKAAQFAVEVYNPKPLRAENLSKLASTNHYTVQITEPFTASDGPKDLNVLDTFTRAAFALTEEDPISQVITGEDGAYLIALYKKWPSEVPPLEAIRERVVEDYRRSQALTMARQEGEKFYQQLTNSLAQGQSFAAACAEAKVKPIPLPKFSLSTQEAPALDPRLDLRSLQELVNDMPPGEPSPFSFTRDGGYVLYLKARLPVDESVLTKELPAYMQRLRQARVNHAFNEWFSRQVSLARLSAPVEAKTNTPALE